MGDAGINGTLSFITAHLEAITALRKSHGLSPPLSLSLSLLIILAMAMAHMAGARQPRRIAVCAEHGH